MTKRTVYCVQAYLRGASGLVATPPQQFGDEQGAKAAALRATRTAAALVVFKVSGEPDFGEWGEPEVLERLGEPPI